MTVSTLPTPEQIAWQDMELEMFVHFDPATWQDRSWDNHSTPLDRLNPATLDAEQWADVAQAFGAGQIILIAKHQGGFCNWQTRTSPYGVKETPWRGGKGDLAGDVSAICRRRGMRFGVYLSPADSVFNATTGGKCPTPEEQAKYDQVYRAQLTELLTRYGEVGEVWFDGSLVTPVGDILERHAPHAMIFQGPHATIRWGGNEHAVVPYPCWTTVSEAHARSGVATAANSIPDGAAWLPVEADAPMRDMTWFWNRNTEERLFPLETFVDMYYRSVGHGQVMLLGASPDTSGLIPVVDAKRMSELGAELRRRFGRPAGETRGAGREIELSFSGPQPVDHVILMEDIRGGERVREYVVEGLAGGEWKTLAAGTAIGHKKIDCFPAQTVTRLRFRAVQSAGEPTLRRLAAFDAGTVPALDRQAGIVCNLHGSEGTRIGGWSDDLGPDGKVIEIDVTWLCWAARQYRLEVKPDAGTAPMEVSEAVLTYDGLPMPQFLTPAETPLAWNVNITALGSRKGLRLRVRQTAPGHAAGVVLLR